MDWLDSIELILLMFCVTDAVRLLQQTRPLQGRSVGPRAEEPLFVTNPGLELLHFQLRDMYVTRHQLS